jgi:hypothetical protein
MTTGALIFAQNNGLVDYVKLAVFAASRIKKYLNIPVTLATDSPGWLDSAYPNHCFDQVIEISAKSGGRKTFHDGTLSSKIFEWKNTSRSQIYDLTPYDRTLVIESDYIINSSVLAPALERNIDLQIYKKSFDLADWRPNSEFQRVNEQSIPFYWATTFIFNKNQITEEFFNLVSFIQSNWIYFRTLYNIESSAFRNDYAFSIAIHLMNNKADGNFAMELPGTMTYAIDKDILLKIEDNKLQFLVEKKDYLGEYTAAKTEGLDVHVMNKISLSRCIDEVLNVK